MLVPVFFRAMHGGLHDHVAAQVTAAVAAGWEVTLMCPSGPFADAMEHQAHVLRDDFRDQDAGVRRACAAGPFDLIHAHPWASLRLGVEVGRQLKTPLIVTRHNTKTEDIPARCGDIDLVVAISDLVRDAVARETEMPPERIAVIPNGVDLRAFRRSRRQRHRIHRGAPARVLVASRFDDDKRFIIEVLEELWTHLSTNLDGWPSLEFVVAGDGGLISRVRDAASVLNRSPIHHPVQFTGWLDSRQLIKLMRQVDVSISPGRSALQSLALGVPTIGLGGRGYLGFIDGSLAPRAMYQHFGSREAGWDAYPRGQLGRDLRAALASRADETTRELGKAIARSFSQERVDRDVQRLWSVAKHLAPRSQFKLGNQEAMRQGGTA